MSPVLDVSIDTGANRFLDTFLAQGAMEGTVGYSGSRDNSIVIDYAILVNKLAVKYIGKLVYVWKGQMKGKVGIMQSKSGDWVCFICYCNCRQ